jgi:hypothetical protein
VLSCNERRFAGDGGTFFFETAESNGFEITQLPFPASLQIDSDSNSSHGDIVLCSMRKRADTDTPLTAVDSH